MEIINKIIHKFLKILFRKTLQTLTHDDPCAPFEKYSII